MKFIHTADCHIGAWRDPKMKQLTLDAWKTFVTEAIAENPDFIILAGDFFNTAIPGIDSLKDAVKGLQRIKDAKIPVYAIAGSHDFSPSGKTMLDVLEEAGLIRDVMRGSVEDGRLRLQWTQDPRTSVKMTGILGKRGCLDRHYYEDLDRESLEAEEGDKIFLFHTSIAELKPKHLEQMDAYPASFLPKNCKYYAGGHVHITEDVSLPGYPNIVYPGPLFPASFSELEKLGCGSYCVVEDWQMTRKKLRLKKTQNIELDASHKEPRDVEEELMSLLEENLTDTIVLLRIHGELNGPPSSINFRNVFAEAYERGAYFVMKNTTKLTSKDFEEVHVTQSTPEKMEQDLLVEHLKPEQRTLAEQLMIALSQPQLDGEKKYSYEERVRKAAQEIIMK